MAKFKIKIDLHGDRIPADSPIKKYPNISLHDTKIFEWSLGGGIYIEFNDEPVIQTDSNYETEYLGYFFMSLMQNIPLIIHGKEQAINFLDSSHFMMFSKIEDDVLIRFGNGHKEELSKMPYKVTNETTISFDEFIKESFRIVEYYINKLTTINPKLSESDELKELIKERDKAKKAIKRQ